MHLPQNGTIAVNPRPYVFVFHPDPDGCCLQAPFFQLGAKGMFWHPAFRHSQVHEGSGFMVSAGPTAGKGPTGRSNDALVGNLCSSAPNEDTLQKETSRAWYSANFRYPRSKDLHSLPLTWHLTEGPSKRKLIFQVPYSC